MQVALAVAKDIDNTKSKTERCAFHWSRPVLYYLELTHCAGCCQVRWPSPKIKDTLSRSRSRRPSPGALAVAKDKRYALSGPSPGCAGRRQRPRQHEVKDRKMRVPLVSLVQYYLELTNCAGRRQVALAVAKDKRYAVAVAVATQIAWAVARCAGRRQR